MTSDDHDHGDVRYLAAKRSVDDRCVNPRVRDALVEMLPAGPSVYDAGAGTGVWLPRLVDWGVTPGRYHGVDTDPALVREARRARADEFEARGVVVDRSPDEGEFRAGNTQVRFTAGDALDHAPAEPVDLVMAGSFLDLVPVAAAVDRFGAATADGGVVYAPATFDGGTFFAPTHRADDAVERVYHEAIDRVPGRSVTAGREAVAAMTAGSGELLAVGSSDWVVRPTGEGTAPEDERVPDTTGETDTPDGYPNDEAYFLDRILGYVADALLEQSVTRLSTTDPTDAELSALVHEAAPAEEAAIRDWLASRRASFRAGELTYVAHQLDLLYRP